MQMPGTIPHSGLELEFAQFSDKGRVRAHNEDYAGFVQPSTPAQARSHGWLFALADGVGGQDLGEVASRTAVESLLANFSRSAGGESHASLLRRLIQAANQDVYERGRAASPGGTAMATTVVACTLRHDRVVVAHVGDSRCYLVRNGRASALTRDHTVSGERLSRSLGNNLFVSVDIADHALLPGDVLLLCSDGLHNSVRQPDLARYLGPTEDLETAARQLIALANQRDGRDNITAQAIRVASVERTGMYRGRPYRLR